MMIMIKITKMATNAIMVRMMILLFLIAVLFASTVSSVVIMALNGRCWPFWWHEVSREFNFIRWPLET